MNDLWDRDIDRKVARTAGRPLASGALRPRQALVFLARAAGCGLLVLLQLNRAVLGAGHGIAGAGRAVSAGQAGDLVAAADDGLHLRLRRAAGLRGRAPGGSMPRWRRCTARRSCGIWGSTRSTRIRIARTTRWSAWAPPRGCSASGRAPFLAACYAGAVVLLAIAGWLAGLSIWFYPALLVPAALLLRQVVVLDIHDPALCLRLFRANREVGLAVARGDPARLADPTDWCERPRGVRPRQHRRVACAPLVPEIALHLASEITPIWQATEDWLATRNVDPPYWAFAWPGGQALARHILDHPAQRRRQARARFRRRRRHCRHRLPRAPARPAVEAAEIDPLAVAAIALNAEANGVAIVTQAADDRGRGVPLGPDPVRRRLLRGADDRPHPAVAARDGRAAEVWLADPGRAYLPQDGRTAFARYTVPTTLELECRTVREVALYRLAPEG